MTGSVPGSAARRRRTATSKVARAPEDERIWSAPRWRPLRPSPGTSSSLIAFVFVLAGCNTVEGVGKDVKATGQAIEKAADKNKTY